MDSQFTVFSDLPRHIAPVGGSILLSFGVTSQMPDNVILESNKKTINLYAITCHLKTT